MCVSANFDVNLSQKKCTKDQVVGTQSLVSDEMISQ